MKNRRKRHIIDKKFQLGTALKIIGLVNIIFLSIIAIIIVNTVHNNKIISETIVKLNKAIEVEDNIVNAFIKYSSNQPNAELKLHTKKIQKDHEESISTIKQYEEFIKNFSNKNFILISGLIILILAQSFFLFLYLIRMTNKIAGPIHLLTNYIKDILDGKKPEFRSLRKKDELKEFHQMFVEMVEKKRIKISK